MLWQGFTAQQVDKHQLHRSLYKHKEVHAPAGALHTFCLTWKEASICLFSVLSAYDSSACWLWRLTSGTRLLPPFGASATKACRHAQLAEHGSLLDSLSIAP